MSFFIFKPKCFLPVKLVEHYTLASLVVMTNDINYEFLHMHNDIMYDEVSGYNMMKSMNVSTGK